MDLRSKKNNTTNTRNSQQKLPSKSHTRNFSTTNLEKKKSKGKEKIVKESRKNKTCDKPPIPGTKIEKKQKCPCGREEPNCIWDKPPLLNIERSWNNLSQRIEVPWIQCDSCNMWWHLHCSGLVDTKGTVFNDDNFLCLDCQVANFCISIRVLSSRYTDLSTKDRSTKNSPKTTDSSKGEIVQKECDKDNTKTTDPVIPETQANNSYDNQGSKEYIVIIDQIDSAFRSSLDIRSEIKKVYSELEPKYCYPLPKGGIALHLNTKEEEQTCLGEWPPGSFRTQRRVKPHKPKADHQTTVVAKNVNIEYSDEEIREDLVKRYKTEITVRRIINSHTKTTYPVVKITLPKALGNQLLNQGVIIYDSYYHCETLISNIPTRCFKCQKFGHIARHCYNQLRCALCAGNHSKEDCTSKDHKCANCNKDHCAHSKDCEIYI